MDIVLDCETRETAIESICSVIECQPSEFIEICNSVDLEYQYEESGKHQIIPFEKYILEYVSDAIRPPFPFSHICWFHGSRTTPSSEFTEGLLPLKNALPIIWAMIIENAPDDEVRAKLADFQENGVGDHHYETKVSESMHWGPYAFLVKESLLDPGRNGSHDYIKIPEIIEDICNGYEKLYGISILDHYIKLLTPCIVKFITPENGRSQDTTLKALCYAYSSAKELPIPHCAITTYNGYGNAVAYKSICGIDYQDP